jgi:hypothetical protein
MKFEIANSNKYRKVIAVVSFCGFLTSSIIHFLAVFGINLIRSDWVMILFHFGMFIPMFLMIQSFQKEQKLYKLTENGDYWKCFFQPMPKWIKYLLYITVGYVALNFFFMLPYISQVKTAIVKEKYVLVPVKSGNPPQNIIKEITQQEYEQQNSYHTRSFSGHWLLFYLMPTLFFWFERAKPKWVSVEN